MARAFVLVYACACGRIGFDTVSSPPDAAVAASCGDTAPCVRVALPGDHVALACAPSQPCRVDCVLAASCAVDCAGRDDCVVACPPNACTVTRVPADDASISCGYVALPTRDGTTATCP